MAKKSKDIIEKPEIDEAEFHETDTPVEATEEVLADAQQEIIEEVVLGGDENSPNAEIVKQLTTSYVSYAMSVIVARALPDVRDGLKPVQRRIMWGMHRMGVNPGTPYKKVARVSGEVMGKYHPHGSTAIVDALVRMGQDWNMRYLLVEGQGNFGSIDGDPHAADRYIEARLHKNSTPLLQEVEQRTVDFNANFDGEEIEPEVLPAQLPYLLLNGAEGIAVGMATKIPPHNLGELIDATQEMIKQGNSAHTDRTFKLDYQTTVLNTEELDTLPDNRFPEFTTDVEIKTLLKHIQGPDFPTAGEIYDIAEIQKVYETGRGRVLMRGISHIEELKGGKFQVVITQLPYQVNKTRLITSIANLVKTDKLKGISDIKDLSNREGIRIAIELKKDAKPKIIQNKLYKYSELQKAFNANMLALVDGEPQILNIKQLLSLFLEHRQRVVIRKFEFDLAKKREREHILAGLMIALDHIDEIIRIIRASADADAAKQELIEKFKLSVIQAQAILDMQLRRLAALERQKIEEEYNQIRLAIADIISLLSEPKRILELIGDDLKALRKEFGDARRTKVIKAKVGEFNEEDLVPDVNVFVTISEQGYIKRIPDNTYEAQGRGGVGKKAMTTKEDDAVRHVFSCSTHDQIIFFTNKGRAFTLKVHEVPEYSTRSAKGVPVINLINIEQGELVTSVLTRRQGGAIIDEDISQEGEIKTERGGIDYKYLFMATRNGTVKKTELAEFDSIRSNGLIAIKLDDEDELIWVKPTTSKNNVLLVTQMGKSILFNEEDVRETGRASRGVRGIRIKAEDHVISMDVIRNTEDFLLTISRLGFGKVTKLHEFPLQNRGGGGVYAARVNDKTGKLAVARILDHPDRELLIMSAEGQAMRVLTKELPERNRQTVGVRMMKIKGADQVAAIAII
jgi:DNA gyrase subunit A